MFSSKCVLFGLVALSFFIALSSACHPVDVSPPSNNDVVTESMERGNGGGTGTTNIPNIPADSSSTPPPVKDVSTKPPTTKANEECNAIDLSTPGNSEFKKEDGMFKCMDKTHDQIVIDYDDTAASKETLMKKSQEFMCKAGKWQHGTKDVKSVTCQKKKDCSELTKELMGTPLPMLTKADSTITCTGTNRISRLFVDNVEKGNKDENAKKTTLVLECADGAWKAGTAAFTPTSITCEEDMCETDPANAVENMNGAVTIAMNGANLKLDCSTDKFLKIDDKDVDPKGATAELSCRGAKWQYKAKDAAKVACGDA